MFSALTAHHPLWAPSRCRSKRVLMQIKGKLSLDSSIVCFCSAIMLRCWTCVMSRDTHRRISLCMMPQVKQVCGLEKDISAPCRTVQLGQVYDRAWGAEVVDRHSNTDWFCRNVPHHGSNWKFRKARSFFKRRMTFGNQACSHKIIITESIQTWFNLIGIDTCK